MPYFGGHRVVARETIFTGAENGHLDEYVYGLDYIDEPVAAFDETTSGTSLKFILQDANYNVVALTDSSCNLHQEYHYSPYGELVAAYESSSDPLALPDQLDTILTFQGGMLDPETGNIEKRARTLLPYLGRFAQKDPNQTGLLISSALLQNAQSPLAMINISAAAQYNDGMNLYLPLGANPITNVDPGGTQFSLSGSAITGATLSALYGATSLAMRNVVFGEEFTAGEIAATLALDAGLGVGGGFLFARLANGLAARAGIGAVDAAAAIGLTFGPVVGGPLAASGIRDLQDASTYGEAFAAVFDIATGGTIMLAPHLLLYRAAAWNLKLAQAARKVPKSWGAGQPNKVGIGRRWADPKNANRTIRIDKGEPNAKWRTQQVDHVRINDGGVVGRGGVNQPNGKAQDAHIPLDEWLKWRNWNAP